MKGEYEVVTFKADRELVHAMEGVPNRSAFIRQAIMTALDARCPVCVGAGVLTPSQKTHWEDFTESHHIEQCEDCSEIHLVCDA